MGGDDQLSRIIRAGLQQVVVIALAVQEHDGVGHFFDGAGFAQVRQLRALVRPVLRRARELRNQEQRDVKLLRRVPQATGHRAKLQMALCHRRVGCHLVQVVYHHQVQPAARGKAHGPRPYLCGRQARRHVQVETGFGQARRRVHGLFPL